MSISEPAGQQAFVKAVYPELRRLAGMLLRNERPNHTLQRTALVNELFMRLLGRDFQDLSTEQFLALAAHQMRQILVDYGRRHRSQKRGGELTRVPLFESEHVFFRDQESLLILNDALERLGAIDPKALAVVELKFFAGCTNQEAARILGVTDTTVETRWRHARAWLFGQMNTLAALNDNRRST